MKSNLSKTIRIRINQETYENIKKLNINLSRNIRIYLDELIKENKK